MNKISILGLGPGNLDYILPISMKKIKESDVIIGGKRHIESLGEYAENKEYCHITGDLQKVLDFIKENRHKKMSLILSGDTGFYSMLTFMRKHFLEEELEVIPGISSIQYMFARISDYWYDGRIASVHGKEFDYVKNLLKYGKVGLLTDFKENTPQNIAKKLTENNLGDAIVYVGENLSYENEKISKFYAKDLMLVEEKFDMNVVVLKNRGEYKKVEINELQKIIVEESDYILLDVRPLDQFEEGYIKNAENLPLDELIKEMDKKLPDKNKKILIYCRSGNKSKQASLNLLENGYTNVIDFGGIEDWNGEIEK